MGVSVWFIYVTIKHLGKFNYCYKIYRIMLAKFSDFNISGYALTNVAFSYKFAFKNALWTTVS